MSAQPGSGSESLSDYVLYSLLDTVGMASLLNYSPVGSFLRAVIRKIAHIAEFTLFDISLNTAFYVSLRRELKRIRMAMLICFVYACTDEIHQYFVPGRNASFTDVLVDCIGPLIVSALLSIPLIRQKPDKT